MRSEALERVRPAVPVPAARQRGGPHRSVRDAAPIASSISAPTSGCGDADDYVALVRQARTPARRGSTASSTACPSCIAPRSPAPRYVSGVGCNATATTLAIWPLAVAGLLDAARGIICEVKVGSSEGGAASSDATHHPERAGVMRSFAPTGHRHTAEVLQALRLRGVDDRACT